MDLRRISAIARPIDLRYPTNRAIAVLMAVVLAGEFFRRVLSGSEWLVAGRLGFGLSMTVFLAWALCRELDPDRDLSAFGAAGLALVGALVWGLPGIGAMFWLLLIVRVVNRTTGLRASLLDSLALLALATWLSFNGLWPCGGITAVAMVLDGSMEPANRRNIGFGVLAATLTIVAGLSGAATWSEFRFALPSVAIAVALSILFVPVIYAAGALSSVADDTKELLGTSRVRAGQMLGLFAGVSVALWAGVEGLLIMLPLWAAVLGASAFLLIQGAARKPA